MVLGNGSVRAGSAGASSSGSAAAAQRGHARQDLDRVLMVLFMAFVVPSGTRCRIRTETAVGVANPHLVAACGSMPRNETRNFAPIEVGQERVGRSVGKS